MSGITIIQQGESLPFSFNRGGESIAGFVCTIFVKEFTSDSPFITRVITPTNANEWTGFLTESETSNLDPGMYYLIGLLTNSATDEREEIADGTVRFNVSTTWVGVTTVATTILKTNIVPAGTVNGVNPTFVLPDVPILNSEIIFIDTAFMCRGVDYTISGDTITFLGSSIPKSVPAPAEVVKAAYTINS